MTRETFNPPGLPQPIGPYAQCAAGSGSRTIFVSGQVPQEAEGRLVGRDDVMAQVRQVLANVGTAVKAAGGGVADICKITVFLVDLDEKTLAAVARARREFFGGDFPASTLVQVKGLASPDWKVEIEAYAVV
jgi:enamine deaminase RidA (YjgF/YER057c/UK114 family)